MAGVESEMINEAFDLSASKLANWELKIWKIEKETCMLDQKDLVNFVTTLFKSESYKIFNYLLVFEFFHSLMTNWSHYNYLEDVWELSIDPIFMIDEY